ncbi:MAG: hypothetical protein QW513_04410 [Candidatus Jordarchaeales archaeon]
MSKYRHSNAEINSPQNYAKYKSIVGNDKLIASVKLLNWYRYKESWRE